MDASKGLRYRQAFHFEFRLLNDNWTQDVVLSRETWGCAWLQMRMLNMNPSISSPPTYIRGRCSGIRPVRIRVVSEGLAVKVEAMREVDRLCICVGASAT